MPPQGFSFGRRPSR